jgi:hypothetical protein
VTDLDQMHHLDLQIHSDLATLNQLVAQSRVRYTESSSTRHTMPIMIAFMYIKLAFNPIAMHALEALGRGGYWHDCITYDGVATFRIL